jgi:hypothetical protein
VVEELEQRLDGDRPQELLDLIETHLGHTRPAAHEQEEGEEEGAEEGEEGGEEAAADEPMAS